MYKSFKNRPTRKEYQRVLFETIEYINDHYWLFSNGLNWHVLEQLNDIKLRLNDFNSLGDPDDINERYDFGAIALEFLDEGSEAQLRLCDVFWGVVHYSELSE